MDIQTLTAAVVSICRQAGQYLLDTIDDAPPALKGTNDLISKADTGSEDILIRELGLLCPEASIVSEEKGRYKTEGVDGLCWVIDPLDGTVNYSFQIPVYSISVALLREHAPVLGVVYAPAMDEMFTAQRGRGAYLNARRISCLDYKNSLLRMIATSAGMTESDYVLRTTSYHDALLPHYNRLRLMGSQCLHLCYVAAGRLDAALTNQAKLWDDAAGALILEEAGGIYSDFHGAKIFPLNANSPCYNGESYSSMGASSERTGNFIKGLLEKKSDERKSSK